MSIADLEASVSGAIDTGKFDVVTAVTLLQKYNVKGATHNVDLIVRMLVSCIATFNKNEVDLILAQLPAVVEKASPSIEKVLAAENALQSGQFVQFWTQWSEVQTLVKPAVPAFEQTLKATIAEILSQSFVKLASTEAAAMLNSKDAAKELAPFGGKAADGFFTFPSTSLNDPKPIKKEPITLERLLPLTK